MISYLAEFLMLAGLVIVFLVAAACLVQPRVSFPEDSPECEEGYAPITVTSGAILNASAEPEPLSRRYADIRR